MLVVKLEKRVSVSEELLWLNLNRKKSLHTFDQYICKNNAAKGYFGSSMVWRLIGRLRTESTTNSYQLTEGWAQSFLFAGRSKISRVGGGAVKYQKPTPADYTTNLVIMK